MSDLQKRLAELPPDKRELLLEKLRVQRARLPHADPFRWTPITRVPRDQDIPLSFSQQRLWFLDRLEGASAAYNLPSALRLIGPLLHRSALEQAVNEIVRRHEALRTTFTERNGRPIQLVAPTLTIRLPLLDLRGVPADEQSLQVRTLCREECLRPFDLSQGPLFRGRLLRLAEDEHIFLSTCHHMVADAWSVGIFIRELAALYQAFVAGTPSPLEELSIQYADYAVWQRTSMSADRLQSELEYWKEQLKGIPSRLELPTDRPRIDTPNAPGRVYAFTIPQATAKSLKDIARQADATFFMIFMAVYATLLHRYCGQEDIVIGAPMANRNRRETESMIGFVLNTLALRVNLSGDPSFLELLSRVRNMALDAYAHQEVPFDQVVDAVKSERRRSHSQLYQVMLTVQSEPAAELNLLGLTVEALPLEHVVAKYDLTLSIDKTDRRMMGTVEYNAHLFEPETVARMMQHFCIVLASIVSNPTQRLSELCLMTQPERDLIMSQWNRTETGYPRDSVVYQLFEAQVAKRPDAVAVDYEGARLTYGELNARANQVAHWLRKLGVGPETLVGLYVERSLDMIVGMVGILKAGGAYLPLDLAYPTERLAFMIEDASVRVLLTQSKLKPELSRWSSSALELLELDSSSFEQESRENPISGTRADNLAYVIYTSGSTGKPKGVAVVHRAINRLVCDTNYIELAPSDRIAQASNASFDAATFEIWGALLHGAQLIGIPRELTLLPQRLVDGLRQREISVLFLTTALFNQCARETPDGFLGLRYVLFGGEAVDPKWVAEVLEKGAPGHLLHVYGPTENTTYSTWHAVQQIDRDAATIPIGRPIGNTQAFVLDQQLRLVPFKVAGELYVSGDGLARGYLNRPELTAERFIPNPFSNIPGQFLYKTGDLVELRPQGDMAFLGRIDQQVKIRGFRVELGEIEMLLVEHPKIDKAVVIAREEGSGSRQLVAYLVAARPGSDPPLTNGEIRAFLKATLPDFMVPTAFVWLETIPLTVNGKTDRSALPVAEFAVPQDTRMAPRSCTQKRVAAIWSEVMGIPGFGVQDDFFDYGGHSLLATRVVSRLRDEFRVELPLRTFFEGPTIARLAEYLDRGGEPAEPLSCTDVCRLEKREEIEL